MAELEFRKPNCLSSGCMSPSFHPAYIIPESIMRNIFGNRKLFYCYHPKPIIWEWKCPLTHLLCSFAHGKISTWSFLSFSPVINSYPFFKLTIFSIQQLSFLLIKSDISILFHCLIQSICCVFSYYFTCVLIP